MNSSPHTQSSPSASRYSAASTATIASMERVVGIMGGNCDRAVACVCVC